MDPLREAALVGLLLAEEMDMEAHPEVVDTENKFQ
jgi:hypothetical protein